MADTIMVVYSFNEGKPLQVAAELKAITELVQKTKCRIDPLPKTSQEDLEKRILLLNKGILIFHFAGHAGGASIELNDGFSGEMFLTNMEFFSEIIAEDAQALRLVFLNGCSTEDQSVYLRAQGIPAVISTTLPLDDDYGFAFAKLFYDKFFNKETNLSLQDAFDKTLRSFKGKEVNQFFDANGGIKNQNLLHPAKRGAFAVGADTPTEIYRIDGDPAVLAQTFEDWQAETPARPPGDSTDHGKTTPSSHGASKEHSYLLCDRDSQVEAFEKILKGKVAGLLPEPNFVFINGHNSDGILELLQRVEKYMLPGICTDCNSRIDGLKFPEVDIKDDDEKPLLHLKEIFKEQLLNKPGQKLGDDTLFLLCHKILEPTWKDGFKNLFQFYLGEYSKTIRQKIGKRVVVLVFLQYDNEQELAAESVKFVEMCQKLQETFKERVVYFDKLPLIERRHITAWHESEFETSINAAKYPIDKKTMYFVEARDIMIEIIKGNKQNA